MRVLLFLLLLPAALAANCVDPVLHVTPASLTILEGGPFAGRVTSQPNGTTLGMTSLDGLDYTLDDLGSFTIDTNTELTSARFLFFAVTPEGCSDTLVRRYDILHGPRITAFDPVELRRAMREGEPRLFSITANATIQWLLDGVIVGGNGSYVYAPNYNAAGRHRLTAMASGQFGLSSNVTWNITVLNVNRAPLQIARINGVTLPIDGKIDANLSYYFIEPDDQELSFAYEIIYPRPEADVDPGNVTVVLADDIVTVTGTKAGKLFITYTAFDPDGLSASAEPVNYVIANIKVKEIESLCGNGVCLYPETCSLCEADCGPCTPDECVPEWDCTDWGVCTAEGYEYRSCAVINDCEYNESDSPPEVQECLPDPSCQDGIRNGNENGVDCGGICEACPTCFDDVQNQGETGVDCGGPCNSCPTCNDLIQNQDETDIDCGGGCDPCDAGLGCALQIGCESRICVNQICAAPTCFDSVQNQGEERVDCGGSCMECPTCSDGIRNQRETGVDCGGQCGACPTCTDRIQNQGEQLKDCGGPCATCTFLNYLPYLLLQSLWILGAAAALFALYLLRAVFASRLLFLMTHNKLIHYFYEDELTYVIVRFWNLLARPLRFGRYASQRQQIIDTIRDLEGSKNLDDIRLRAHMIEKLRSLYASILLMPSTFEFELLVVAVRRSRYPAPIKVVILRNTKVLYILEKTKLYSDAGFALLDVLKALRELARSL